MNTLLVEIERAAHMLACLKVEFLGADSQCLLTSSLEVLQTNKTAFQDHNASVKIA